MLFSASKPIIQWEVEGQARFLFRRWADECAVYDTLTGDTHLLSPLGLETLLALQEAPATSESLCVRLASRVAAGQEADIYSMLEAVLHDFERLALIRRTRQ